MELEFRYERGNTVDHMLTRFQFNMCHFWNMNGRYINRLRQEYNRLMIIIRWELLESFWSTEPGTVRGSITMLRKMGMVDKEGLEFEGWFPLMGPYSLK